MNLWFFEFYKFPNFFLNICFSRTIYSISTLGEFLKCSKKRTKKSFFFLVRSYLILNRKITRPELFANCFKNNQFFFANCFINLINSFLHIILAIINSVLCKSFEALLQIQQNIKKINISSYFLWFVISTSKLVGVQN